MPGGRPLEYNPETHPAIAENLSNEGCTQSEIAEKIGVHPATITDWKHKYPEFSEALKRGKQKPDDIVQKSLYTRAIGYEYTETKIVKDETGCIIKTETVTKQMAPDVGAQCMWLKNRRPEEWRDKQEIEHSGKDGGPIRIVTAKDLSDDDLAQIAAGAK